MPRALPAIVVLCLAVACGPAPAVPLAATFDSPEAVAREVLRLVTANDLAGLSALALSEAEFRDHVWPHLPVSRPERNVPFEYVWGQQRQRSDNYLRETLARHGGRAYDFVAIRFDGERSAYGPITVHRDSVLTVRTAEGADTPVRLFGSVLEEGGRFKVYSFVVD